MSIARKLVRVAVCACVGGLALLVLAVGQASAQEGRPKVAAGKVVTVDRDEPIYSNADFYTADGKFNEEAAKKAYFDMMQRFNYPVNETIRKNIFVSDMGLGKFTEVGLAAVVLINEKQSNYAALEVFLLPNQMIPEHWHVGLPDDAIKEKLESWVVRYGTTFTYGAGDATDPIAVKIPECQKDYVTVRHEQQLKPGESTGVAKAGDKHWQLAGPDGCILTEIATYHDGKAVRFSDPNIKF